MQNKTDAYKGFDPTQVNADGCSCSDTLGFNLETMTWEKKKPTKSDGDQEAAPDCSELEAALLEKNNDLVRKEAEIAALRAELEEANNLSPVYSIGDVHIFDAKPSEVVGLGGRNSS